jgi:hypothetical protein
MLNKYMKLAEIRASVAEMKHDKMHCRDAVRAFLRPQMKDFQVMLTLTLKQSWYDKNGQMKVKHYLSANDLPSICSRFEHKLNRLVWKSKYTRHKTERLKMLKAWEDGRGTKRKHLHLLIGNLPKHLKFNLLPRLVEDAAKQCYEIDAQYDATLCDTDALDYITKEVGKRNTDNMLW